MSSLFVIHPIKLWVNVPHLLTRLLLIAISTAYDCPCAITICRDMLSLIVPLTRLATNVTASITPCCIIQIKALTPLNQRRNILYPYPLGSEKQVILPSWQANAHGPKGDSGIVRVLFDSCSNFSFIRKETAQRLNLTEQNKMPMTINTFGCKVINRDFFVCKLELSSLSNRSGSPRKSILVIAQMTWYTQFKNSG